MITYLRNLTLHFQRHLILDPHFLEFESFNFIFCGIFYLKYSFCLNKYVKSKTSRLESHQLCSFCDIVFELEHCDIQRIMRDYHNKDYVL